MTLASFDFNVQDSIIKHHFHTASEFGEVMYIGLVRDRKVNYAIYFVTCVVFG